MSRQVTIREYDYKRGVPVPGLWRQDVDSKEILHLRQAGESVKKIAEKFGIAKSTVCERLKKDFSVEYMALRVNQPCITYYAQCARAYKLYRKLRNYHKVAKEMGCVHSAAIGRVKFMAGVLQETEENLKRRSNETNKIQRTNENITET